jgi:predicted house-cleaning noncanonical NTP pyrophosphatase (MazG superfamily)
LIFTNSIEYNKLVRDKIPEIIQSNGDACVVRVLNDDEYKMRLKMKLMEEVLEYQESGAAEELADVCEVILALAQADGVSPDALEALRAQKAEQRGAFHQRLLLIRVDQH